MAKEVASKFNPSCTLTAHHEDIKDRRLFPLSFFRSFTLVFNALDNLDARRYVNKMCLAADVPLIESGTTGFNGQVQVIKKNKTACYDCSEKEVPKTYPICTIRSTPSQPIHSIVWAKSYLLPELFGVGEDEEQSDQLDFTEDADNAEEIQKLEVEAQALKRIRKRMGEDDFAREVFDKVFKEDIDRLRSMEEAWKSRTPPISLDYGALRSKATADSTDAAAVISDQQIWSLDENFVVFANSLRRLSTRLMDVVPTTPASHPSKSRPIITFDKDDPDTLDFVTSASNLRSHIFSIPLQSKFTVKQMAGNIIPAIATTNAMTAGLCVIQAVKVMKGDYFRAKMVFLEMGGARALNSEPPRRPNPGCAVCGVATGNVDVDSDRATLNDLVNGVLKSELGYKEMTIMNDIGPIYDPDMDDMLSKKFSDLDIKGESFLTVIDDEEENPRVNLQLAVSSKKLPEGSRPVILANNDGEAVEGKMLEIGRRPKRSITEENGHVAVTNGDFKATTKRTAAEAGLDEVDQPQVGDINGPAALLRKDQMPADCHVGFDPTQAIIVDGTGPVDGSIVIED